MRTIFLLLAMFVLLGGAPANSSQPDDSDSRIQTYRFQPCSSWSYDFDAHAYVCRYTASTVEVPDAYSVDSLEREVRQLENKVSDLERRVQQLESK